MDPTRILFVSQIAVQVVLLCLVAWLIVKEKKQPRPSGEPLDDLLSLVEETRELNRSFSLQMEERTQLVSRIMRDLDEKIADAEALKQGLESLAVNTRQARNFAREDVLRLHRGGYADVDIAQITGMPVGEIQLMIKVGDAQHDQGGNT